MRKNYIALAVILVIFLAGCSSASASPAARILSGLVSAIVKRLWSLKPTSKTAVHSRSMVKFESGYTVETVFDGSKLGIEPHSVGISMDGEIFILDSENSNIYKISSPLTRYSRTKLLAGSAEGHTGHVDGKLRQARMNHPKGLAVDDNGNIYIADTMNMVIRKISDDGVVTIAGGKSGRGGEHVDGPSEEARFSDDFDLVYIGSSCSLLVIDRGHQAIREIQLHEHDCSQHDDENLHLGIAVLVAACFFGYMLALLQCRISTMLSYDNEPSQRPPPKSVYPPLIPPENENERQEEGLFTSLGRLFSNTGSSVVEILGGLFSTSPKKKPVYPSGPWPVQESFVIPREDGPPPADTWHFPTTRKSSYPKQNRAYGPQPPRHVAQLQHHQMHRPTSPHTSYYEPQSVEPNEIVFGAVQEQEGRREGMVIKAVDDEEPVYNDKNSNYYPNNVRSRYNYMSYSSSSYGGY
ncbi:NHL domain-containing protein [Striga hermonthica]|uniref:NHL domain-containing protein n=1 Tax=Striga hermonthica TaxID=68872 RepID=A0A9N7RFN1_STRHE|nr:NHL domain-containing protein [Striga hermonthica]